jgi:hypothetical protein
MLYGIGIALQIIKSGLFPIHDMIHSASIIAIHLQIFQKSASLITSVVFVFYNTPMSLSES